MRKLLSALLLAMGAAAHAAQAAPHFTFSNEPGPYGVGLRIVEQYDYARVYKSEIDLLTGLPATGERARPIETLIWYPAQKGGTPLTYLDYLRSMASEENFGVSEAQIKHNTDELLKAYAQGLPLEQIQEELRAPMWAVRDATRAPGKFPVVIYAPSFGAPAAENADLCEYLASQGYIVIASPDMGRSSRNMTKDVEGIETEAADIRFLIGYAHGMPEADNEHLAVIGYSWGGISNVFAAARDDRIKALVSLDGSVRYFPKFVNDAKYVTPENVKVPFLFVASQPMSLENLTKFKIDVTSSLINDMKYSDVYLVTMNTMKHADFGSDFLRFEADATFPEYSRAEASLAHSWAARYTLHFLDVYLKDNVAGKNFLHNTPVQNAVPAHMLSVDFHAAQGKPASLQALSQELARHGYAHVEAAYQAMHKEFPAFKPSEENLADWAMRLQAAPRDSEALEILKFSAFLYPESVASSDALADAYERLHDKALAIKTYKHSLKLEPADDFASLRLKGLETAPATKAK